VLNGNALVERSGHFFYWAVIDPDFVDVADLLWGRACSGRRSDEGGLASDLSFVGRVHIHSCGNGGLWFRPDGDSLFLQAPKKSKQKNARPERTAPR
jgi:hypothetical protein